MTLGKRPRVFSSNRKVFRILVLGIVLAVFQQWCGINVIFNYAEEVFSAAGYQVSDILFNIVITGTVNLLFTLAAFALVDRFGRRILMLSGAAGLAVIYTLLGGCYAAHSQGIHVLALVVGAIGCYAMSLAPVTWVVISEIFPNRIRGTAMSIAVGFLWVACFILTYTFPLLNRAIGAAGTFWIYAGICVAGFVFLLFKLPETRGKSLEAIEREFEEG
jgi:MFS family permease